jgi:hypothetical protein
MPGGIVTVLNEMTPVPGRRLGKHAPSDAPAVKLSDHYRAQSPAYTRPASADNMTGLTFMMGGNDRFGTCGPTSVANYLVIDYAKHGETITVTDDAIFELYRHAGNPGFDPATDADDNGVDMKKLLGAYAKHGLVITHQDGQPERVYPAGWAALDHHDPGSLADGIGLAGAIVCGQALETAQQEQTSATPPLWDYEQSDPWGGHATVYGAYTGITEAGLKDATTASWTELIGTTDAYVGNQLDEAYVIVSPATAASDTFNEVVDAGSFAADFEAQTGQKFTPVTPAPTPGADEPPAVSRERALLDELAGHVRTVAASVDRDISEVVAFLASHGL